MFDRGLLRLRVATALLRLGLWLGWKAIRELGLWLFTPEECRERREKIEREKINERKQAIGGQPMGYYIEGPCKGKVNMLVTEHGATVLSGGAFEAAARQRNGAGIVCVVDNGGFEAAGFMHTEKELECFAWNRDTRPKTWLAMDRKLAAKLSGCSE